MKEEVAVIDSVEEAYMQEYQFAHTYSAIFLRWCLGYVADQELVAFLKKCKYWLKQYKTEPGLSK